VPLNVIQRQLGHANLGTNSIYGSSPGLAIAESRTAAGFPSFREVRTRPNSTAHSGDKKEMTAEKCPPRGPGERREPASARGFRADSNFGPHDVPSWSPRFDSRSHYLLGTEDKAIPPALQRFMAERANATIVEVPASHVSFVSQPDAATELILHAVEATMSAAST
jgi:pimeloyl-ACP methyl ester carboxylesterase